jgi:hypothetical protein
LRVSSAPFIRERQLGYGIFGGRVNDFDGRYIRLKKGRQFVAKFIWALGMQSTPFFL